MTTKKLEKLLKHFFNKFDIEKLKEFKRLDYSYDWGIPKNKLSKIFYDLKHRLSKAKLFLKFIFEIPDLSIADDLKNIKNCETLFVYNNSDYRNPEKWYKRYYGESKKGLSAHLFIREYSNLKIVYFNPINGFNETKNVCLSSRSNYKLLFFLPIIPLYPLLYDFIIYKKNISVFNYLIKKLIPERIVFPFEGQSWEHALVKASSINKVKSIGFIHALNITTAINSRINFSKNVSPDLIISININQGKYLIEEKNWPKDRIKISNLRRKSPLDKLLKSQDYRKNNLIIFLGSYFKHEDDFAIYLINYHKKFFNKYEILYKPHPLNMNKINNKKLSKNFKIIDNLKDINNIFPEKIISPLSSTSSLEILSYSSIPVLIYKSQKYICPNPFDQFNIQPIIIDEDNLDQNILFNDGPLNFIKEDKGADNLDFKDNNFL